MSNCHQQQCRDSQSTIETSICHRQRRRPDCLLLPLCCIQRVCPEFSALGERILLPACELSLCLRRTSSTHPGTWQPSSLPATAHTPPRHLRKAASSSQPTVPLLRAAPNHVHLARPVQQQHGLTNSVLVTNHATKHYVFLPLVKRRPGLCTIIGQPRPRVFAPL